MRKVHIAALLLVLALIATACARSASPGAAEPEPEPTPTPPAGLPAPVAAPATVEVDLMYGDSWRPLTAMESHVTPGSANLRLSFSKPVRRAEVEQALLAAQAAPIRGALQWTDDQTLYWQIAQLPPRIDFLLGGAHDQDGLALPGGIPSLRVGEPATLVEVDPAGGGSRTVAALPPDIIRAALSADGKYLNLTAWSPGTTRWDWRTTDMYLELASGQLKPGRADGFQPRLPANLESWTPNPGRTLIAGLRPTGKGGARDLVVSDLAGGRLQVTAAFVSRADGQSVPAPVWAPDGTWVAAASDSATSAHTDVVAYEPGTGKRTVLARDLPVPAGQARLAVSASGRWLLAGPVLTDLQGNAPQQVLTGNAAEVRGAWAPAGGLLAYTSRDWDPLLLIDPAGGESRNLGAGLLVDWAGPDRLYVVRWPAAATRYLPPGQ